jgi:hypothetical protein
MWIQELVNCLEGATLKHPRTEEVIALKQPHLPKRIYKYRCDSTYARENLKTDTVWMASPDTYNDPYDCSFQVAEDEVVAALKMSLFWEFAKVYKFPRDQVIAVVDKALSSGLDPLTSLAASIAEAQGVAPGSNPPQSAEFFSLVAPKMIADTIDALRQWRKITKVCSFSKVNDSILMWGHYAQHHQGFCMEYDLKCLEADHGLRKILYPVVYSPLLYDLTVFAKKLVGPNRDDFNPSSPLLGVLHKFDGWTYEQEWRAVTYTPGVAGDYNWTVPTPSRVFLGAKMEAKNAEEVAAICASKGIEVCRMMMAKDKFELLSEPYAP